jgi:hypothetical protein
LFVLACCAAAAAVAIAMGSLAGALGRHPAARDYIECLAERVLAFILIGIGALILADLPSDVFVG